MLPHRLRYKLAYDHRLCRAVLGVFSRALLSFERRRARQRGVEGRASAVTAIQRCGSALNTNIHFHTLVAEGVFEGGLDGPLRFVPSWAPPRYSRPRHFAWAELLQRTFSVDVLACPECGGRLRFLATIAQREVIEKILSHLGLPT